MTSTYEKTTEVSKEHLGRLRGELKSIVPSDVIALTCGSYARGEATVGSDLDFYVVVPDHVLTNTPEWLDEAKTAIGEIVPKAPSFGGAFGTIISRDQLLNNFGGDKDTNSTITRRMLYLLEGAYLSNESEFKKIRHEIIEHYVSETREDHHIAQYLLNDIIRYWRTITVDYAFKTQEGSKPWAIRNIKLVFSRKLIYASGLFSVGMTANRSQKEKIEILGELFEMTPLDRMREICGKDCTQRLVSSYDKFLTQIDDEETRNHLEMLRREDRDTDEVFRDLKNEGYRFGSELLKAFDDRFHSTHPIHRAVIF